MPSGNRAAAFFSNCKCAYRFDRRVLFEGIAFPNVLWEILRHVMPLCNIRDTCLYPTGIHVNYYKDGYSNLFQLLLIHVFDTLLHALIKITCRNRNAGLGWHEDNEMLHGPISEPYAILSLSLGATRTFLIQRSLGSSGRSEIIDIPMRAGDLLSMNGLFQQQFKHK